MKTSQERGFTLVELLTVVAILAIAGVLAVPSLNDLINRYRADSIIQSYALLLGSAREEAVKRQVTTTLCPTTDNRSCHSDWNSGVMIFSDTNGNALLDLDDSVIYSRSGLHENYSLEWKSFYQKPYIQFLPMGYTLRHNGTFVLCPANGNPLFARLLILNKPGRVRPGQDKDGDGVQEKPNGKPVQC
ncbi:MAG: hypothetical protein CSB48_02335 [Proteobacteria bacterium]|nr:MAG: hypothetical protein CSB48_02335 [Pseudomonadota bacterium]